MNLRIWIPLLAMLVSGCVKEEVLITVRPDGSGVIRMESSMNAATIAMLKQATTLGGEEGKKSEDTKDSIAEIFTEQEVRDRVKDFGEGVTFTSLERTRRDGSEGVIALFAFKDIRTVMLPLNKSDGPADEEGASSKKPEFVRFEFSDADPRVLTVKIPQPEKPKREDKPASAEEIPGMGAAMLQMFKGLEMKTSIAIEGAVVSSTASHPGDGGSKATLMAVRFDDLLASPDIVKILEQSSGEEMPVAELIGQKGFVYETKPEIRIEFK